MRELCFKTQNASVRWAPIRSFDNAEEDGHCLGASAHFFQEISPGSACRYAELRSAYEAWVAVGSLRGPIRTIKTREEATRSHDGARLPR
jgi:hypothetical protein